MKKVTKYEANDGTIFDTEAEAIAHDRLGDLKKWYEKNNIYSVHGDCVDWTDLTAWCYFNKGKLHEILSYLGEVKRG